MSELKPGDIMFGDIGGFIPGVFPVAVGQLLLSTKKDRSSVKDWWHTRHAAVVGPNGDTIIQAMPHGVEEVPLSDAFMVDPHKYLRFPDENFGLEIALAAQRYLGIGYSFLDYYALFAAKLDNDGYDKRNWVEKRVTDSGHMICSQHVDQSITDAGQKVYGPSFHVFDDGRLSQDVYPAELYRRLINWNGIIVVPNN